MHSRKTWLAAGLATAAIVALTLSGCASGSNSGSTIPVLGPLHLHPART